MTKRGVSCVTDLTHEDLEGTVFLLKHENPEREVTMGLAVVHHKRRMIDEIRRRTSRRTQRLPTEIAEEIAGNESDPAGVVADSDERATYVRLLLNLATPRQKMVATLLLNGTTRPEIQRLLGITDGTYYRTVHDLKVRALKYLETRDA